MIFIFFRRVFMRASRMGMAIVGKKFVKTEMRVYLGCGERFMSEHFTHGIEIGAVVDHGRGKGMPECVGTFASGRYSGESISYDAVERTL